MANAPTIRMNPRPGAFLENVRPVGDPETVSLNCAKTASAFSMIKDLAIDASRHRFSPSAILVLPMNNVNKEHASMANVPTTPTIQKPDASLRSVKTAQEPGIV